jgi:hypothetical protein
MEPELVAFEASVYVTVYDVMVWDGGTKTGAAHERVGLTSDADVGVDGLRQYLRYRSLMTPDPPTPPAAR